MYTNLILLMKQKKITARQIAKLIDCRDATISERLNGVSKNGFYFDEARKIKEVFFPEYDYEYLFQHDDNNVA